MRLALGVVLLSCLAAASLADAARSPLLEKLAPRAADTKTARSAVSRIGDLPTGWRQQPTSSAEEAPPCRWNLSRFTITGKADSTFVHGNGALYAEVDVFADAAQARGDYAVQVDAGALGCEGQYLRTAFGPSAKLVSAQALPAPRIGDRAAARRWVFKVELTTIYVDFVTFVRGRAIGSLFALIPGARPLPQANDLARLMDERLRSTTS